MKQDIISVKLAKEPDINLVTCIHCGKTTFGFSNSTMICWNFSGTKKIDLKCPKCNNTTVYFTNGTIEAG